MKHKRIFTSISMVTIVLVALCAVGLSPLSVSGAEGSRTTVQTSAAPVGASVSGAPAACEPGDLYNRNIALFVKGSDNALWWKLWDSSTGTWSAWQSLGGPLGGIITSDPAVTSFRYNEMDVFVRGTDGALYQRATYDQGASWTDWSTGTGQLLPGTGAAAYAWYNQRIGWFVTGTDNALWHQFHEISTSNWQGLGGYLTSSPAAGYSVDVTKNYVDVFVRGGDSAIWYRAYTGYPSTSSWSNWKGLGGLVASGTGPAASSWIGRFDVFVQGTDGQLWWKYTTNGGSSWSGWKSLSGALTSSPGAAPSLSEWVDRHIDVFVRGTDGAIWQKTYSSATNQWSGWKGVGAIP